MYMYNIYSKEIAFKEKVERIQTVLHLKSVKELLLLFDLIHPSASQKNIETEYKDPKRKKNSKKLLHQGKWLTMLHSLHSTVMLSSVCRSCLSSEKAILQKSQHVSQTLLHLFHIPLPIAMHLHTLSEESSFPEDNQKQKDWKNIHHKTTRKQQALPITEKAWKDKRCHGSTYAQGLPANQISPRGAICPIGGIWFHTGDHWISFFLSADGIWRSKPRQELANGVFSLWWICSYHECKHRKRRIKPLYNILHVFLSTHIADQKKQIERADLVKFCSVLFLCYYRALLRVMRDLFLCSPPFCSTQSSFRPGNI